MKVSPISAEAFQWWAKGTTTHEMVVHKPALASWDVAGSASQRRLSEFRDEVASIREHIETTPAPRWIELEIVRPTTFDLHKGFDVENYLTPLVQAFGHQLFVLARGRKRHGHEGEVSTLRIGTAVRGQSPIVSASIRASGSYSGEEWKDEIRKTLLDGGACEVAPGKGLSVAVAVRIATRGRNWVNLWKPTGDALGPLLGEPRAGRKFHPADDRVVDLEFHLTADEMLRNHVEIAIRCRATQT